MDDASDPPAMTTPKRPAALLRTTLVYALTNLASSGVPFLMLPVLTRVLSPHDYGMFTAFSLAVTCLAALTGLSVHGAVAIRYFESDRFDLPRYVGACFTILLTTTAAVSLVTIAAAPWIGALGVSAGWVLVATLVSACQFAVQIRLLLWQSAGQAWRYGALRLAQASTDAATSLLLVLAAGLAWQGRALGITAAALLAAAIGMATLVRDRSVRFSSSMQYVPDALRFGAPLVVHTLGGLLITTGDKMIVGSLLSLRDLGTYAVAAQLATVLNVLYDALFKAFQPWVIERALLVDRRRAVVRTIYKLLLGTTAFGVVFLAVAYLGYPHLVGDSYRDGIALLAPLVAAGIVRCGYFATAIFISVAGRNEHLAVNSIVSGGLGLAAAALLVPRIGIVGAAYGVLLAELFSLMLNLRSSTRVFPMPWSLR
jgi:O-antigen/teichoic acid export membrane protein